MPTLLSTSRVHSRAGLLEAPSGRFARSLSEWMFNTKLRSHGLVVGLKLSPSGPLRRRIAQSTRPCVLGLFSGPAIPVPSLPTIFLARRPELATKAPP